MVSLIFHGSLIKGNFLMSMLLTKTSREIAAAILGNVIAIILIVLKEFSNRLAAAKSISSFLIQITFIKEFRKKSTSFGAILIR